MILQLKNVRLSFPDLWTARKFNETSEPKYSATFLVPKGSETEKAVKAAIKSVAEAKWGKKADGILKSIENNAMRMCWQDGDNKEYDGYAGNWSLKANNKARPLVLDKDKTPLSQEDGRPYAGCYVNASVELFAYTNSGNGVSASLRGVQFVKDGDAFSGGAPASQDEFTDLSVDSELEDVA